MAKPRLYSVRYSLTVKGKSVQRRSELVLASSEAQAMQKVAGRLCARGHSFDAFLTSAKVLGGRHA